MVIFFDDIGLTFDALIFRQLIQLTSLWEFVTLAQDDKGNSVALGYAA